MKNKPKPRRGWLLRVKPPGERGWWLAFRTRREAEDEASLYDDPQCDYRTTIARVEVREVPPKKRAGRGRR